MKTTVAFLWKTLKNDKVTVQNINWKAQVNMRERITDEILYKKDTPHTGSLLGADAQHKKLGSSIRCTTVQ